MKSCPVCHRTFEDTLTFCLVDGSILSSPFDPEATQRIPSAESTNPPPTEMLPPSASPLHDPLPPTIQSPLPVVNQTFKIAKPVEKRHVGILTKLTRGFFMKIIFGVVSGYLLAAIVALPQFGFDRYYLITTYPVGAVYGLVTGIIILMVSRANFFKRRSVLTGTITGAGVGVLIRYILLSILVSLSYDYSAMLFNVLGADPSMRGGWIGATIFGAVLGAFLGFIWGFSTNDVV